MKAKRITYDQAQEIKVRIIKENKDGSANAEVEFNKQGLETLIQWGLVSLLATAIDAYKVKPDTTKVVVRKSTTKKKRST